MRNRVAGLLVISAVFLGLRTPGASAAPAADTPAESIREDQLIGPSNNIPATVEEVRDHVSLEDMAQQGFSLKNIQRYYPNASAAEVAKAKKNRQLKSSKKAHLSPFIQPMISIANCYLSTEFCGVVRVDGSQTCFAYAGTYNGLYITMAKWLCPGNNMGRALYSDIYNNFYWSPWRGPVNPLTYCYAFTANVTVQSVEIA